MIPPLSPRALRTRWSLQRLSRCASAAGAPAAVSPAGVPAAWGASNRGSPVIVPPASVRAAAVAPVTVRSASNARAARVDSRLTGRTVEAMGLCFPSPLLVAALSPKGQDGTPDRTRKVMVFVRCDVLGVPAK